MSKTQYSDEYKQYILQEVAAGVSVSQLARDYDPCAATIHLWLREGQPTDADLEARSDRERELQKQVVHLERQVAFLKNHMADRRIATPQHEVA